MITDALKTRYLLSNTDALKIKEDAETLEEQAPDTVRFTKIVKDAVPYEDRSGTLPSRTAPATMKKKALSALSSTFLA